MVGWVLISRIGLRAVGRVLEWTNQHVVPVGPTMPIPHATTVRWWLLRVGYYKLHRPKEQADDWVWIIDHSNQIGQEKCLVVLGIRLVQWQALLQTMRELEQRAEKPSVQDALGGLRLEDMEIMDLEPVKVSDKKVVYQQLERNASKTGVPRVIIDDHGGDLAGGVQLFREAHPETIEVYDIAHKAACLLKARLERDERWKAFTAQVGQCKCQLQQTELAFLIPPSQRLKARYMNLEELIHWGEQTLVLLDPPPPEVLKYTTVERLEAKLGWLRLFRVELNCWSQMQQVIQQTLDFVRRHGYYRGAEQDLEQRLGGLSLGETASELRAELVGFVQTQAAPAREGECFPGSSEVLESCFGKYKSLEREHVNGGLTSFLLALAASVSRTTQEVVRQALESCKTKDVIAWIKDKVGITVGSQRRRAYHRTAQIGATKLEGTALAVRT